MGVAVGQDADIQGETAKGMDAGSEPHAQGFCPPIRLGPQWVLSPAETPGHLIMHAGAPCLSLIAMPGVARESRASLAFVQNLEILESQVEPSHVEQMYLCAGH